MIGVPLLTAPQPAKLMVKLANQSSEIEQAMRLRYQIFVEEEKNLRLRNESKLETDDYDVYCDHLIVKELESDQVIGTYRLLPGDRASEGIGFYSETEFDLDSYSQLKKQSLELGRSCIAPEYRGGRAISMLWEGIASYISNRHYTHLIGCASIHIPTIQELNEIYTMLCSKQVLTERYGIKPRETHRISGLAQLDLAGKEKEMFRKLPPLMKGYQRLGAEIGGDPAYDELFGTVDFFIIFQKAQITSRYKRHYMPTDEKEENLSCTSGLPN